MNRSPRHTCLGFARCRFASALLLALAVLQCEGSRLSRGQSVGGGSVINREYPLKAAYLYNFGGYIEWPSDAFAGPESPFVIGVLGTASFDSTFDEIAQRKIAGRRVVVNQLQSANDVKKCHIVFVVASVDPKEQAQAIAAARGLPLLVVGESAGFSQAGGAVRFFVEHNKVRFEINPEIMKQQRLRASSKLLSLATLVEKS